MEQPPTSRTPHALFGIPWPVVLLCAVLCFSHIHQGTLAVDAIRYAHIALNINALEQYFPLVDELVGNTYTNKPPVLFWILALLFSVFGFSTFIAKFPAVLFAFVALLVLWRITRRHFGEPAATLAVALLALNGSFTKDVVDLNFEGMVLLGVTLCLGAMLKNIAAPERAPWSDVLLWTLGAAFILASKPPYLIMVAFPAFLFLVIRKKLFSVICSQSFFLRVLPFAALLTTALAMLGSDYIALAMDNQVGEPLRLNHPFLENLSRWLVSYFVSFAPLSFVLLFALYHFRVYFQNKVRLESLRDVELFLLLWLGCILPIILLSSCRARYLLVPILAGAMLSGSVISQSFPRIRSQTLYSLATALSGGILLVVFVLQIPLHRNNPLIAILEADESLLDGQVILCIDSNRAYRSPRETRHTELLLNLEFGLKKKVFQSTTLDPDTIRPENTLLMDSRCAGNLSEAQLARYRALAKEVRIAP